MTKFTGGDAGDLADAGTGVLSGFAGGTVAQLQDLNDDRVFGGAGGDRVSTGGGNDRVFGGTGDDALEGGDGSDALYGGTGNDTLTVQGDGLTGQLFGGAGADVMTGSDHNDIFEGGRGIDSLYGGTNVDVFRFLNGDDIDFIDAGGGLLDGIDTLELSFVTLRCAVVDLEAGVWQMTGGPQQTILNMEHVSGTQMDDIFTGTASQEFLLGLGGADVLYGRGGIDQLDGGEDRDRLYGQTGSDKLFGGSDRDLLRAGAGNDLLVGGTGNDRMIGSAGNDNVIGGDGHDLLRAGRGHDLLHGNSGLDTLLGAAGSDVLDGGSGADSLRGGAGADQFLFTNDHDGVVNVDRIADFEQGKDLMRFLGPGSGSAFGVLGATVDAGEVVNGAAALDGDDYLIYDAGSHTLYLDSDGSGAASQRAFAVLEGGPATLTAADFLMLV